MPLRWKLGRIAGIDVFVHATFLLVFLFTGVSQLWLVLSVFACVLLHEFGHALMARRFGIGTVDITLYPIGGVARLRRMPRAAGAELLIALAGPAVNFAIVAALLVLESLGLGQMLIDLDLGRVLDFLVQLGWVNLFLGLFNLIPAFPMDGGRVLRALLSGVLDRGQATSIAAGIGRFLAVLFGTAAILWTHDLLHVALAAFIYFASRAEEMQVLHEERQRRHGTTQPEGVWVAPPGYRWVQQGNGVWQLAPIVVPYPRTYQGPSSWS
jgi:Zn-dependent protease